MAEPFIGQISLFGFGFVPKYWAVCAGQALPINQNAALYSILGTTYGGDGRTTFALPDLRGVAIYGAGIGSGSPNIGAATGTETVTLTSQQLASHNHTLNANTSLATLTTAANNLLATTGETTRTGFTGNRRYSSYTPPGPMSSGSLSPTGGGGAHNNMQPYIALNYCIALVGTYPRRP